MALSDQLSGYGNTSTIAGGMSYAGGSAPGGFNESTGQISTTPGSFDQTGMPLLQNGIGTSQQTSPTGTGKYSVSNGQLIGPDGKPVATDQWGNFTSANPELSGYSIGANGFQDFNGNNVDPASLQVQQITDRMGNPTGGTSLNPNLPTNFSSATPAQQAAYLQANKSQQAGADDLAFGHSGFTWSNGMRQMAELFGTAALGGGLATGGEGIGAADTGSAGASLGGGADLSGGTSLAGGDLGSGASLGSGVGAGTGEVGFGGDVLQGGAATGAAGAAGAANSGGSGGIAGDTSGITAPGGASGASGANPALQGGALSRIMAGNASTADWLSVLGSVGSTGLGIAGSAVQSKASNNLSNQLFAAGQPSRDRFNASMTTGFDPMSIPGYSGAVDSASQAILRGLSTQGNPYGNPGGLINANKQIISGTELPAIQAYQALNANAGGLAQFAGAAPGAATNAIGAQGNIYNAVGSGLASLTNPQPTLAQILASLGARGGSLS